MSDRASIIEALLTVAQTAEEVSDGWTIRHVDDAQLDHAMEKLLRALERLQEARTAAGGAQYV